MEFFLICAGIAVIGLFAYMVQFTSVYSSLSSSSPPPSGEGAVSLFPSFSPPVSILKPLKGLDDNLFDNLASFCMLDYPDYEIIFSVRNHNDPAYKIACMIKQAFPDRDISVLVMCHDGGLNPKVNNLIPAYRIAKHPYILVSDSNVQVERTYLADIMQHMADPAVGLVSNMIRGVGGRSLGSVFENLHMNSFVLGSVCFLDRIVKMPCVIGKSMLMRRADLDAIGGFDGVKDVLAEDYLIGRRMHESGKQVVLSNHMINNVNEFWGVRKFLNRHTRWAKLRWKIGGFRYVSELIGNPVFIISLPLLLWEANAITLSAASLVSLSKILGDYAIACRIAGDMSPFRYLLVPVKDIIIGLVWFIPLMSSTVTWRGNRYLVGKDSVLSPCQETVVSSLRYRLTSGILARLA